MDISNLINAMLEGINPGQLSSRGEKPGYHSFSLSHQVDCLGLNKDTIKQLRGANVLDVGCGRRATLVRYLRRNGINAEGIDPTLEIEGDYLIRRSVSPTSRIPRPDNHYDVVLAHSVSTIWSVFSSLNDYACLKIGYSAELSADEIIHGEALLTEMFRVTKPGGKIISNPILDRHALYNQFNFTAPAFSVRLEYKDVKPNSEQDPVEWEATKTERGRSVFTKK